jgi:type I restriction enzyme S subunit
MTSPITQYLVPEDRVVPWRELLPGDWHFSPLKYLVNINHRTLREDTDPSLKIKYIDIGNVNSDGKIIGVEELEFGVAPSRARRIVISGDVLVSTVRTYLKAIAFCEESDGSLICSTGFAVLSPQLNIVPKFLFYWVRSLYFIDEIVSRSTGVSYPAVNAAEIGSLPFPILSKEKQQTIVALLDGKTFQIDNLIEQKEQQIELLKKYRQTIITEAVTGKLG